MGSIPVGTTPHECETIFALVFFFFVVSVPSLRQIMSKISNKFRFGNKK